MSAPAWDAPVIPQCPETKCCFRCICASWIQAGVAALWRSGQITRREQCFAFAHRAKVHFETTGRAVPGSVAELEEQLAERRAIATEGP